MAEVNKERLTSQVIKGSFWNIFYSIIQRAGGIVFTILLARLLLPEKFGIYNLAISISFIFLALSYGGIDEVVIRYVSAAILKNKKKRAAYFQYVLKLKVIIFIISFVLLLAISYPLSFYIFNKPLIFVPLLLSAFYILLLSFESLFASLFFAMKRIKYVALKESIYQLSRIIIVILISLFAKDVKVGYVMTGLFIASLITFSFDFYMIRKKAKYFIRRVISISEEEKSRIRKFMFYLVMGSLSFTFFGYIDTIMIGLLIKDASYIGFYRAAFILVSSIGGFLTLSYVLLPILTQVEKQSLERVFNKVIKYSMIISIPAGFGIAILGKYFLIFIYGREYLSATLPLVYLAAIIPLGVFVSLFLSIFSAKEKPKEYLPLLIFIILLNIVLNYILINYFSRYSTTLAISGAAMATVFCWIVYSVGLYILAKRKLNIKVDLKLIIKPILSSIIMVLALLLIKSRVTDINLFNGVALVVFGVAIYTVSILLMKAIDKKDLSILIEISNKKLISLGLFKKPFYSNND